MDKEFHENLPIHPDLDSTLSLVRIVKKIPHQKGKENIREHPS